MTIFSVVTEQAVGLDEHDHPFETLSQRRVEITFDDRADPETYDFLARKLRPEVYAALKLPDPDEDWLRLRSVWAELSTSEWAAFATQVEQAATASRAGIIEEQGGALPAASEDEAA